MARYRHEYKYLCNVRQKMILMQRVQGLLHLDSHALEQGYYRIRSLYFDTPEDMCFYDNENGVSDRAKFRLRIYNGDSTCIRLEKKIKKDQMGYKLSCALSEMECRALIAGEYQKLFAMLEEQPKDEVHERKGLMFMQMQQKLMCPKVIVEYKRTPFVEPRTNVRVTFDEEISSSNDVDHFLDKDIMLRPINALGDGILEVKWDGMLPDYIRKVLQLNSLMWSGYSKYYYCRKFNLYGGIRI